MGMRHGGVVGCLKDGKQRRLVGLLRGHGLGLGPGEQLARGLHEPLCEGIGIVMVSHCY